MACWVRLTANEASFRSTAATRQRRPGSRSASSRCRRPPEREARRREIRRWLAEGIMNRLVRAQLTRGPAEKGKQIFISGSTMRPR